MSPSVLIFRLTLLRLLVNRAVDRTAVVQLSAGSRDILD
ncbi:hypothetical protein HMPREF0868_0544 [Mageeibacillus indolicus UPII9-5]|uniref:Uncharacterized protein n=1 Tax=Mageeibacillus indolicus (strain UPII9-5) TaxID=699246 RepID=D3R111_MAGIU|nr:hypothetical protein HMPREF0868_0544 [Mageeibacillus indolicus UPII9-5]